MVELVSKACCKISYLFGNRQAQVKRKKEKEMQKERGRGEEALQRYVVMPRDIVIAGAATSCAKITRLRFECSGKDNGVGKHKLAGDAMNCRLSTPFSTCFLYQALLQSFLLFHSFPCYLSLSCYRLMCMFFHFAFLYS